VTNEAHTRLDLRGIQYAQDPLRFALFVSILSWWLSFKWNHRVSRSMLQTTSAWIAGASRLVLPRGPERALQGLRLLRQRVPKV
jgi:hypothetical protein